MSDQLGEAEEGGAAPRARISPFVLVCGLFLLAYWAVAAFVVAVDPYDVRPWGVKVTPPSHLVTPETRVLTMAVAKDSSSDLVMIGSSTAAPYGPEQLRAAFPGVRNPMNYSYFGARPGDRDVVAKAVAQYTGADRVVIWIDWTYIWEADERIPGWPDYLFDSNPANDLRMVNHEAIVASIDALAGRSPLARTASNLDSLGEVWRREFEAYQSPAARRATMARYRESVDALKPGAQRSCDTFGTLTGQLAPALRTLAARGKTVDLVLPPYSVVFYGDTLPSRGYDFFSLLAFRRCLALAAADMPRVSIWALDSDTAMITDLGNYRDAAHLYSPDALRSALAGIGDPRYRLTPENVDDRNEALWRAVQGYRYATSYSDPETSREPRPLS
jgi:hypothetical protein